MISPAAALASLLALAGWQGDVRADRLVTGALELRGPVDGLVFEVPGAGSAAVSGSFAAGTSVRAALALPASGRSVEAAASASFDGAGSVELDPRPELDRARRARFEQLPRGLRARAPVTPPEAGRSPPSRAALLLVAGLFALGWQVRRRGVLTLALGVMGGAAVFLLGRGPGAADPAFTVAEGQGPTPVFVLVEAARERLFVGGTEDLLRLESRPTRAELVFESTPAGADLTVTGAGATLFAFRDGSALSAGRDHNGVFDLEQVWMREEGESAWVALGPWLRGTALPPAPADGAGAPEPASAPPGWLVGALPQGQGVLVGGGGSRWLRWIDVGEKPTAGH